MQATDAIVYAFLGFLVVGAVSMALSVRRGRILCNEMAERDPSRYAALGRPYPGFFRGPRFNAYMQLVMQRGYSTLGDRELIRKFEQLRRWEILQLVLLFAGFAMLGAAAIWYEFVRAA